MPTYRFAAAALLCVSLGLSAQIPSALATDPASDKASPASMQSFQLPSHGEVLNAFVYVAAGATRHPVVVLLHGFPGNERNLDLAQTLRRAGYDVLYLDYRGSWGSPGNFSFSNSIEDVLSAIAYMREAGNAARLHADPKKIVLIGHSMGGFLALNAAALDPAVSAVISISAADLSTGLVASVPAGNRDTAIKGIAAGLASQGMAPLVGCTPEGLAQEVFANAAKWNFVAIASKLATRPVLVITSDDGLARPSDQLVTTLRKLGDTQVQSLHFATDHSYSDHRIALQEAILKSLDSIHLH
ncbi:alpha/beta hydrolase family protein [Edaphobacter modestus]|uniref:Alpha/beta hydrolase family protein n=1 Tax=Edaphobacter modestus TaxID=388466 RepID=A0A4Q7YVN0_9BACT|nr:alpha/beta hydrolase [Edaphobacter modestus]RZU41730.1 alpha/beta hydrolase family protein [Edaphobacter modestus]